MALAWDEYGRLERSVEQLRAALQAQLSNSAALQVRAGTAGSDRPSERVGERANERVALSLQKSELKRELWRIEDVLAGLSASKANFKITIDSVQNPGEFLSPGGPTAEVRGQGSLGLLPHRVFLARSDRGQGQVCQVDRVSVQQRGNLCL